MESPSLSRVRVMELVSTLLNEIAGISTDRITESSTIDGELLMESLKFVELQVAIEDTYNIELDPIEIVELNRLGDIVDYIHGCVMARA